MRHESILTVPAALLVAYALSAGCADDTARSDGSGVAGTVSAGAGAGAPASGMGGGGSGGAAPSGGKLSFATDVYDSVIRARCSACHTDAPSFGGLAFFPGAATAYANLVSVPAGAAEKNLCRDSGLLRVQPGDPDRSLIYLKLTKPSCGSQMPPAAFAPPSQAQIELVRKWIADGAPP